MVEDVVSMRVLGLDGELALLHGDTVGEARPVCACGVRVDIARVEHDLDRRVANVARVVKRTGRHDRWGAVE